MKTQRGFVFRLDPTPEQARTLSRWAGVCRAVYNAALFQRERFGRKGRSFGFAQQCRELTSLRAAFDWVREVSQTAEQQALKDLQRAFENFYADRAAYPTPRRKHVNESFRLNWRECGWRRLNRNWACVRLPKIGDIRFRLTRAIPADIRNITVSQTPLGWHVAFCCAMDIEESQPLGVAAGIDRGVANSIALSNGETPSFPRDDIRTLERRQGHWQRVAARRKRGSKRYARARRRAAALKAKAARARRHWNHVQTSNIAAACEIVVLEDLRIANMTASARGTAEAPGRKVRQKAGLNRSILETGWGQFEQMLKYKLAERGGRLVKVDPKNTSRTCQCGCIDARNRESQALFRCVECGYEAHADVHAARNILKAGTLACAAVKSCANLVASIARALRKNPRPSGRGRR